MARNPPLATVLPFDVVDEAWRLALAPALAAAVTLPFLPPVGIGLLALAFGVLWFHRDPDRSTPDAEGIVVAPADGTVSVVRKEGERLRVGVFMNVTDVHVNRAPLAGEVREVRHRPGANRPAFDKESDRNEQVAIDFGEYELLVIAGWFARRIHPSVEPGDAVDRGERVGHVSFGSRADVILPADIDETDLLVSEGDAVRAGETIIAERDRDRRFSSPSASVPGRRTRPPQTPSASASSWIDSTVISGSPANGSHGVPFRSTRTACIPACDAPNTSNQPAVT